MTKWKEYPLNREYLVSDDGQILGWYKGHHTRRKLKQSINKCGYAMQKVNIGGKQVSKGVHRIMAETFLSNPLRATDVDHINGNKLDNRLENLQWLTHRDNCRKREPSELLRQKLCVKVAMLDINRKVVKIYDSVTDAGRELVANGVTKNKHCNANITSGIRKKVMRYGYYWEYARS